MKRLESLRKWIGIAVWTGLGTGLVASAASVVYTIDSTRSSVTMSGTVLGSTVKEQAAGSLTTRYSGSIGFELSATNLQFLGGSQIRALTNGNWEPKANGDSGSAPANYGAAASVSMGFFTISAKAALRNIQLDTFSPPLPLVNGSFDSSGLLFMFPTNATSVLDYNASVLATGSKVLAGYSTNQVTTTATLATTGGVETLTIPINASQTFEMLSPNDSTIVLKGQLVATRSIVSMIRISSVSIGNQKITLQWTSVPGQKYQILGTTDLKNWTPRVSGLTATGASMTWSTNLTAGAEFLRIGTN
jgi:hypothetical protein